MAVGLIALIELEMLLLENRGDHGGMNVDVEFFASGLGAVGLVFTRRYPNRNTGVTILAMGFVDRFSASPEPGSEQDTEQRVVDTIVRVKQNRSRRFRFDVWAGVRRGDIQLGLVRLDTQSATSASRASVVFNLPALAVAGLTAGNRITMVIVVKDTQASYIGMAAFVNYLL